MNKYCLHCGIETWACECGGHCYNIEEHKQWLKEFRKLDL
jgi:hypothetical protein